MDAKNQAEEVASFVKFEGAVEMAANLLADGMTQKQARITLQIYAGALTHDSAFGRTDVKEFSVKQLGDRETGPHIFSVLLVIGRPNDEGTNASIFCRGRRHFFVGPRGGVELVRMNGKKERKIWYAINHFDD